MIFLLGGHDLEMEEIARLLKQKTIVFYDRGLDWSHARLSAYREEMDRYGNCPGTEVYGIELQEDIPTEEWRNYFRIDHHNDYSGRPSSLEQVAALLHTELSRRQRLIAANDAGYIPAMRDLGATEEEIREVRLADRQMQGCTDEDECLAELAIKTGLRRVGDLLVVKSLTSRFSPVCDRLWPYNKLLIYTDDTLCYYGQGKEKLVERFAQEIAGGRMYHGGGENGFLGVAEGQYAPDEILQLVQACENLLLQA